jgi:vacuolar protein sorting-associated protein 33A
MASPAQDLCDALKKVAQTELKSTVDRAGAGGPGIGGVSSGTTAGGPAGDGGGAKDKIVLLDASLLDSLRYTEISSTAFGPDNGVVHVDTVNEFSTDDAVPNVKGNTLIYVRPSLRLMEPLARRIKAYDKERGGRLRVKVFFVPKRTVMVHHVLRENGIVDDGTVRDPNTVAATIEDLEIDLFPLDNDVLSMEMPTVYRDLFLDGDLSILKTIARTLVKLQSAFTGQIPNLYGKGAMARKVLEMMKRMKADIDSDYLSEIPTTIDTLVVVDRGVDLLTPFMTQLTYEGIIAEEFGISATALRTDHPAMKLTVPRPIRIPHREPLPQFDNRILLNSLDDVHSRIRDYLINNVGIELHRWSQEIKTNYDRRKNFTSGASGPNALAELKEMREIVQNLPKWQETQRLIGIHVDIATELNKRTQHARFRKQILVERNIILGSEEKMVNEYIEELIDRVEPLPKVLRLLCMMSLCQGGIKQKIFESFRNGMLHAYGFPQVMTALYNFERAGLIVKSTGNIITERFGFGGGDKNKNSNEEKSGPQSASSVPFNQLRKNCKLMADGSADLKPPQSPNLGDVSYYYKGYSPLLCKIVEDLVHNPDSNTGAASTAPGPRFVDRAEAQFAPSGSQRKILVLVIGGVTPAEIACMRNAIGGGALLNSGAGGDDSDMMMQGRSGSSVLITTTSIVNGNEMCRSLLPFEAVA